MNIRNNARAFILNEENEILLLKFEFDFTNESRILWVTPGGGVENGESFEQALERELFEELGIKVTVSDESVLTLDIPFHGKHGDFTSHEVYYLIRVSGTSNLSFENMTANEKRTFKDIKWWSLQDLENADLDFEPRTAILELLRNAIDEVRE